MVDIPTLIVRNQARWDAAKLTSDFSGVAGRLNAAKPRYQTISARTTVPWFVIAVIHEREASQNWSANIAQGDRWDRVSIHVPSGRGPFNSFEDAAYDALVNCDPHAGKWTDWTAGGTMTILEMYNGMGYATGPSDHSVDPPIHYPPQPSPYIWSGTDQYKSGKYVRDHVFKPDVIDSQLGCAGLLLEMGTLDPSIFAASA